MRGAEEQQAILFSYRSIEDRIPSDHPLRAMRQLVDPLLSKNRDRLLKGNIAEVFFNQVLVMANDHQLLSQEHFTVDGTLIEAWASQKSFRPIDDVTPPPNDDTPSNGSNPSVNFHGEKRTNATHRSTTDPDARLAKKSRNAAAVLAYEASVLMDNRHGLIVETDVRAPGYHAERDAALEMLTCLEPVGQVESGRSGSRSRRRTLGADKGYDEDGFIGGLRRMGITPHIAPNLHARRTHSAVDGRMTRHRSYETSQHKRKLVEECFGWQKCVGLLRKLHHRGQDKVSWIFTFASAAYNLVRLRQLVVPVMPCTA